MQHDSAKYSKHILICVNERTEGHARGSCARCGGMEVRNRFVQLIADHGLKGQVGASKTFCLDACEIGPVVTIYPQDIWYVGVQAEDVDAIFEASVLKDEVHQPRVASPETWEKLKEIRSANKPA